jgi:quercetin 2,3-dioxygenase
MRVHVARGEVDVNGHALGAGDALKLAAGGRVSLARGRDAEVLLFDLPGNPESATTTPNPKGRP